MGKTEYGEMPCRECGSTVKVLRAENGTLSYRCLARGCDDADYAKFSTLKNASWLKRIKKYSEAEGSTVPPEKQAMQPKATKQEKTQPDKNIWGL